MKAGIYLKGANEEQAAALRAWVAAKGFTDISEYRDITPLRGRSSNKELMRLLHDAKGHKLDFAFVDSLKDFGLDPTNVFLLICVLMGCGVRLISREEGWTDLSEQDLAIVYFAYCLHLDSKADETLLKSRSGKARTKRKRKSKDNRDVYNV